MSRSTKTYIFTSVVPDVLASGRPVAFGDKLTLKSAELDTNYRLISSGVLAEVDIPASKSPNKES